jgi:hypothetical protein
VTIVGDCVSPGLKFLQSVQSVASFVLDCGERLWLLQGRFPREEGRPSWWEFEVRVAPQSSSLEAGSPQHLLDGTRRVELEPVDFVVPAVTPTGSDEGRDGSRDDTA